MGKPMKRYPITRRISKTKCYTWNIEIADSIEYILETDITNNMSSKFDTLHQLRDKLESPSFEYNSLKDLERGKECLLALWLTLLTHLDGISVLHYKHLCYKIIVAIMQREEFKLKYVNINEQTNEFCLSKEMKHLIHVYRRLVRDTFHYVAKNLGCQPSSPEQTIFCTTVVVTAFFVFPPIQYALMDTLSWRLLNSTKCDSQPFKQTNHHVDLERNFIQMSPDLFGWISLTTENTGNVIPEDDSWRYVLSTEPTIFLSFLQKYVHFITFNVTPPILWNAIPGYIQMIQLLIIILEKSYQNVSSSLSSSSTSLNQNHQSHQNHQKTVDIDTKVNRTNQNQDTVDTRVKGNSKTTNSESYKNDLVMDDALDCATTLLRNKELLNTFIHVIIRIMDMNNASMINRTLHYITKWLSLCSNSCMDQYTLKQQQNPYTSISSSISSSSKKLGMPIVDMVMIINCIKTLLDSEDANIVVCGLTFLYNHMDRMETGARASVGHYLLQQCFSKFFLHSRFEIRCCFHHILIYKLLESNRKTLFIQSDSALCQAYQNDHVKQLNFTFPLHETSKESEDPLQQENEDMAQDLILVKKLDLCIHMITACQGLLGNNHDNNAPSLSENNGLLETSFHEYASALKLYYNEQQNTESPQAPDLSAVLVKRSSNEL